MITANEARTIVKEVNSDRMERFLKEMENLVIRRSEDCFTDIDYTKIPYWTNREILERIFSDLGYNFYHYDHKFKISWEIEN